jgi:hypothetical protein
MRNVRKTAWVILAIFLGSLVWAEESPESEALLVAPGALDVAHTHGGGTATIRYLVRDESPGKDTLLLITEELVGRGWRPLSTSGDLAPDQSRRDGMTSGVARFATHVWWAGFGDGQGNEVYYSLVRRCPLEQHGLHSVYLQVTGTFYRSDVAVRLHAEAKRDPHDCEAFGVQVRPLCPTNVDAGALRHTGAPQLLGPHGAPEPCVGPESPVQGRQVHLEALVDAGGRVTEARLLRPDPPHDQACMKAVFSGEYRPGMSEGHTTRGKLELVCRPCLHGGTGGPTKR